MLETAVFIQSILLKSSSGGKKKYPYLYNRYQNNIVIDYRSQEAIALSHCLKGISGII